MRLTMILNTLSAIQKRKVEWFIHQVIFTQQKLALIFIIAKEQTTS